ncbi:MAG: biopolymer transporter ExbD [Bacteroidales bacterium]|nr:biopolymer transporter ExbD [Bacteroidales bacterium]MDD5975373.1 biopolymer transporter ExbD [Bacteroidales bacterium]MDY5193483.1 biopolymer transporter ExbD [Candidatus Aphodosoma sp.]
MAKRKVQEINASSMADIAFLLLIFFLVTTTMSVDKGLSRRLPPPLPPNMEKKDVEVNKRNILVILINSNNQLMVQGEPLDVRELKDRAKEFILNEARESSLPEIVPVDVEIDGKTETYEVTKNHVISLQNDRGTEYQKYLEVQNELVAAYNEIREEFSKKRFGKPYAELTEDQQLAVQDLYPQKISEAEPKNYGGNK